jgi:cyclophilin family peptidyl-prolyl cis-trans isomerase
MDRATGWPDATLRCALHGFEWVALSAQAQVLGSSIVAPDRRATMLRDVMARAHGQPQVLEAVAESATNLPAANARVLVRQLADERDAGILAALIGALALHPQHARALPPSVRSELLRAPFDLPLGNALEARVDAVRLAAQLHLPDPSATDGSVDASSARALAMARHADAGVVSVRTSAPPSSAPPVALTFETDAGRFVMQLDPSRAPLAVARIVEAARAHRYDGLTFHRVVPGFVAQGGDPRGDGYGGTDEPVATELTMGHFDRGTVGVPLAGLDTGGMQLFVVLADAPHLDGRYPLAGRIIEGMDAADGLLVGDLIRRVVIEGR